MNGPAPQAPPDVASEERLAWAYLSRVAGGPCAPLAALAATAGAVEAARAVRSWDLPPVLQKRTAARREIDTAAADLALAARMGGRLVVPTDPEWPAWRLLSFRGLRTSDVNDAAPLALWIWGERQLTELPGRAVAVVGARAASPYGDRMTAGLVAELAAAGWLVVSGAAFGIDAGAHRAALRAGGCTVAVLACGIDIPYPVSHDRLLRQIAAHGLVISEYPPGTTPAKHRFLARNRLVAGLSDAALVVEADRRSGARNTVKWARCLGRPALAVPGPADSAMSVGCHELIRSGEAILVSTAAEVIAEAGPITAHQPADPPARRPTDVLSGDQLLVHEALPAGGSHSTTQLSAASGVDLPGTRAALSALEIGGFAAPAAGGWRRVRQ